MKSSTTMSIRSAAKRGPLSEYALRSLLRAGKLPGFYINKKYYVNYPRLLEAIESGFGANTEEVASTISGLEV